MKKHLVVAAILLIATLFVSCSKSSTSPATVSMSFKVNINGLAWTANAIYANTSWSGSSDTTLFVTGKDTINGKQITIGIRPFRGKTGTFILNDTASSSVYIDSNSTTLGMARYGQIVLTAVNSNNIQGTFNFTCYDSSKYTSGSFTTLGGF
jgi:Family of unknown function (DUF6252)